MKKAATANYSGDHGRAGRDNICGRRTGVRFSQRVSGDTSSENRRIEEMNDRTRRNAATTGSRGLIMKPETGRLHMEGLRLMPRKLR